MTSLPVVQASQGADTRADQRPRVGHELWLVRGLLWLSLGLFLAFILLAVDALRVHGWRVLPFALMIGGLFYCALAYQLIRYGAARRRAQAVGLGLGCQGLLRADAPEVSVLIPSYQESRRVIIETVLSAALAPYRNKRITVLLDDPISQPAPLAASLAAIEELRDWLAEGDLIRAPALAGPPEAAALSAALIGLADWLARMEAVLAAQSDAAFAHVDEFFFARILRVHAARYRAKAAALAYAGREELQAASDFLASALCAEIGCFQRKTFANLSHAPNKAMNLNAYLGLMGGAWRIDASRNLRLADHRDQADLLVPASDYVLTLDADSVILPDYLLTLVDVLQREPKAAVAQTPYLTFPHGRSAVERIAGATTDIQYLIHQGSSHYNAAYWVGANAVIRSAALRDIRATRIENGHEIAVFVQDKTVIEDTGSTLDLLACGWHVHNHFTPLAYSATPADFGALAIQRKRWANGGLILFGDLLRGQWRQGRFWRNLPQIFVRSHYLLSPLIGNAGILMLMLLSTQYEHPMFWAALFMLPYFLLYMYDLKRMGYKSWELFGVCSLNLMLLPVNLAGVLASLWQMMGGRRLSFSRTPKVASRSLVPPYAFVFNLAILALMVFYVLEGLRLGEPKGVIVPLMNSLLYSYGICRFIGFRAGMQDLALCLRHSFAPLGRAPLLSRTALQALPPSSKEK